MPAVGFEPTISVGERPQTYALDRTATWTGTYQLHLVLFTNVKVGIELIIFFYYYYSMVFRSLFGL